MKNKEIAIGTLSSRTGVAVSALRYWEERGLISSRRDRAGRRRFLRSEIRRVSMILIIQQFGLSLDEIRGILAPIPQNRAPTKADWEAIGSTLDEEITARMARLTLLRDRLGGCIGCGCLSLEHCALYNPEDRIARFGTGPRFLLGNRSAQAR